MPQGIFSFGRLDQSGSQMPGPTEARYISDFTHVDAWGAVMKSLTSDFSTVFLMKAR
jgi:hypothetical protein